MPEDTMQCVVKGCTRQQEPAVWGYGDWCYEHFLIIECDANG